MFLNYNLNIKLKIIKRVLLQALAVRKTKSEEYFRIENFEGKKACFVLKSQNS